MKAREHLRFITCFLGRRMTVMRGPSDNLRNPSPWSLNLAVKELRSAAPPSRGRYIVETKKDVGLKPGANERLHGEVG